MKKNFYLQPIRRFRLSEFRLRIEKMSAEMFVVSSTSTARFVKRRLVLVEEHRVRARVFRLHYIFTTRTFRRRGEHMMGEKNTPSAVFQAYIRVHNPEDERRKEKATFRRFVSASY